MDITETTATTTRQPGQVSLPCQSCGAALWWTLAELEYHLSRLDDGLHASCACDDDHAAACEPWDRDLLTATLAQLEETRTAGRLPDDWVDAVESNESGRTAADVIAEHLNADNVEIDDELSVWVLRGDHGAWLDQQQIDDIVERIG